MKNIEKYLLLFPLIIIFITFIIFCIKGHINLNDINFDKLSSFGGFIGGLVGTFLTIIATLFVYKTFINQKLELKSQKTELLLNRGLIAQQQFETTFFNMLNVHRQLKKDLKITSFDFFYTPDDITYGDKFSGVGVFEKIAEEYTEINNNLIHISYNLENISPRVIDEKLSDVFFLNDLQQDESNPDPITLAERLDSNWTENNNAKETQTKKIIYTYNLLYMNYQNQEIVPSDARLFRLLIRQVF